MSTYNYRHFRIPYRSFTPAKTLAVGQRVDPIQVTTLEGVRVTVGGRGDRLHVIETGSLSCPQFVNWIGEMNSIRRDFATVDFSVVYVREAHPGAGTPEHASVKEKQELAARLPGEEGEHRRILVDDVAGTLHHVLGLVPNSVTVLDTDGIVRSSAAWADPTKLRSALDALACGEVPGSDDRNFPKARISTVWRVLRRAGARATADFLLGIPAMRHSHKVETATFVESGDRS